MNTIQLAFATNNKHKITEVQSLLDSRFRLVSAADLGCNEDIPEDQDTLEGNALQKARYIYSRYKTACIADDTGLEVTALGGAPGVYSARYAGPERSFEDNNDKLLRELADKTDRSACFRCVIALIDTQGNERLFEGRIHGHISEVYKGSEGFGYDPLFIPEGSQLSFAEMSLAKKNQLSHRGRAVDALVKWLMKSWLD